MIPGFACRRSRIFSLICREVVNKRKFQTNEVGVEITWNVEPYKQFSIIATMHVDFIECMVLKIKTLEWIEYISTEQFSFFSNERIVCYNILR